MTWLSRNYCDVTIKIMWRHNQFHFIPKRIHGYEKKNQLPVI